MKELVIFDVDNTIIDGQSQGLFIKYLFAKKYVSFFYYILLISWVILYKIGWVTEPLKAMKYGLSFVKGRKLIEVQTIVDDFFDTILIKKIYNEAREIISAHKHEKREILLVSNAPDILIKKVADYLEINNYLSTRLEVVDNVYTGNIFGEIMYGEQKLFAVKKYIEGKDYSLDKSWAYGDHDSDIFLLSEVGHPCAVNPSRKLEVVANKKKWPILRFNL